MNKEYIASEYRRMHNKGLFSGGSLEKHVREIDKLIVEYKCNTILDYGCGKARFWNKIKENCLSTKVVTLYDPYYEPYSKKPEGVYDMVICTDVLEHIPQDDVGRVIHDLLNYTGKVLFLSIATYPAEKKFANGENVHVTIKPKEWWESMLSTAKDIKIVRKYT